MPREFHAQYHGASVAWEQKDPTHSQIDLLPNTTALRQAQERKAQEPGRSLVADTAAVVAHRQKLGAEGRRTPAEEAAVAAAVEKAADKNLRAAKQERRLHRRSRMGMWAVGHTAAPEAVRTAAGAEVAAHKEPAQEPRTEGTTEEER